MNSLFNKWGKREKRTKYLMSFAPENWIKLPKTKQENHTLAKCKECALVYREAQESFPGPTFQPGKTLAQVACVLAEKNKGTKVPEQTTTVQILL